MSFSHHPMAHSAMTNATRSVPRSSLAMGGVGAIIGGTAAAAKNIRRVKDGEIHREEAVRDTIKEAAGAGLATAAATALVGVFGATGLLSLVGIVAVATGTKYVWDAATASASRPGAASKQVKPRKKEKAAKKDN
jgi:hypothetical protein